MSAERQRTREEIAREMAEITDYYLRQLPPEEAERRLRAFERAVRRAVVRQRMRAQPKRRTSEC